MWGTFARGNDTVEHQWPAQLRSTEKITLRPKSEFYDAIEANHGFPPHAIRKSFEFLSIYEENFELNRIVFVWVFERNYFPSSVISHTFLLKFFSLIKFLLTISVFASKQPRSKPNHIKDHSRTKIGNWKILSRERSSWKSAYDIAYLKFQQNTIIKLIFTENSKTYDISPFSNLHGEYETTNENVFSCENFTLYKISSSSDVSQKIFFKMSNSLSF